MKSREYKYQAWHEEKKLIFIPDYINRQGQACGTYEGSPIWSNVIRQFTGLEDCNKKEAFEYDIIAAHGTVYKITFSYGGFVGIRAGRAHSLHNMHFEIIGNLFENPDLYYNWQYKKGVSNGNIK